MPVPQLIAEEIDDTPVVPGGGDLRFPLVAISIGTRERNQRTTTLRSPRAIG